MRDMKMGGEENGVDGVMTGTGGEEDEKERTIAKAALSIAELGQYLGLAIITPSPLKLISLLYHYV
jgi:hypothetical protein